MMVRLLQRVWIPVKMTAEPSRSITSHKHLLYLNTAIQLAVLKPEKEN